MKIYEPERRPWKADSKYTTGLQDAYIEYLLSIPV